jgi:hypothetical protein
MDMIENLDELVQRLKIKLSKPEEYIIRKNDQSDYI